MSYVDLPIFDDDEPPPLKKPVAKILVPHGMQKYRKAWRIPRL
jgi:hypothetical protein